VNKKLLSIFGLKFNPFSPEVPVEALLASPALLDFCWRIEHALVREGGFALVSGDPGSGKSVSLRILLDKLSALDGVAVATLEHPQCGPGDFYRELGDHFGVELKPHNRWAGFKLLRERWAAHLESTRLRPVLLIDEAQEMKPTVLSELRLLTSSRLDSRHLLSVILAGDQRLLHRLHQDDLLPLLSRIRCRLALPYAEKDDLLACLRHLLKAAGAPRLMTQELMATLADHAAGNYRVLTTMANDLLVAAARLERPQLDEKLFLEVFAPGPAQKPKKELAAKP
jgi:type II secretory pathway predicted ATPase ExeA